MRIRFPFSALAIKHAPAVYFSSAAFVYSISISASHWTCILYWPHLRPIHILVYHRQTLQKSSDSGKDSCVSSGISASHRACTTVIRDFWRPASWLLLSTAITIGVLVSADAGIHYIHAAGVRTVPTMGVQYTLHHLDSCQTVRVL